MSDASIQESLQISIDESEALLCRACRHIITAESLRTTKDGDTTHTFSNPAGYVYTIGCFTRAPGAMKIGEYSNQFSWFARYAWCHLVCEKCKEHLGWHFSGIADKDFHGLILDKLVDSLGSIA